MKCTSVFIGLWVWFTHQSASIGNDNTKLYIHTNKDAPKFKIVTVDLADKNLVMQDLIPEQDDATLTSARLIEDKLIATYTRNVN